MATPRLPFLYPNLMRAIRACEPITYYSRRLPTTRHRFHTSRRVGQQSYQRRYGPAVEPNLPPPLGPNSESIEQPRDYSEEASTEPENIKEASGPSEQPSEQSPSDSESQPQEPKVDPADAAASSLSEQAAADSAASNATIEPENPEEHSTEDEAASATNTSASSSSENVGEEMSQMAPYANRSAFDEVYHMPSPSTFLTPTTKPESERPPHMSPAPYVHHFDTYSLVQNLSRGGFTNTQSTVIMKGVRGILQSNLDFAKESLTSKSDVENEVYLFKAACSELQQSLQTARNSEVQHQRASRGQLEHETDILSQRLNQELAGMKDEIKGMFNDHKMTTREQQRTIDTMVQELNYKITVSLNSDGKSEIEGLRWILTRRAALSLAICALSMIIFLKYISTQKVQEPPKTKAVKEVEKPVKEVTKETRVIHDAGIPAGSPSVPEAHLGESLG
ncbi:Protein of unknown function DUF1640 [Penicillium angulare]|uniref:MOZ protein represents a chromatin-associated acetyltransferase n=1 Tax=Penicillium angulare TaxID=116970 RepID=A0A9W9FXD8_9EURO|nr:Protein of unknown function DUF1640 [Penicillium angulare]